MRYSGPIGNVLILTILTGSVATAQQRDLKQTLEDLLPAMSAEKIPDRANAQKQWEETCFKLGAPGMEEQRLEACTLMAAQLGDDTPNPARLWLLRQLERIGKDECVDAAAALLGDQDVVVRDAARRVLTNNPSPRAGAALLSKMQGADAREFKVALLNSIGYRADPGSAAALAGELRNADSTVAGAAADALGKIGDEAAGKALAAVRTKTKGDLRRRINDAYLACAESLLEQGKTKEATSIYKELSKADEDRMTRLAATKGLLKAAGK